MTIRAFLTALAGVSDPEQKRKIIGREFIRSFEQAERKLIEEAGEEGAQIKFLVQGTLYPDVVESGGGEGAANINRTTMWAVCLRTWRLSWSSRCVPCLRMRFVRLVVSWVFPEKIVARQPFPGPGLGIRIVG